jgi:hypothetical protein
MSLEEIGEIREGIKSLEEAREINIREARDSISKIRTKYNNILKEKGEEYCNKNYPGLLAKINSLTDEFNRYFPQ